MKAAVMIEAFLSEEQVNKIIAFQLEKRIKFFCDAVGPYIESLDDDR